MKILSLDLELNQPSRTIIQIGACIFDPKTARIIAEFNRIIFTHEEINPFITELTGITQKDVAQGSDLKSAYLDLCRFRRKYQANKQVLTWGDGDLRLLKEQVFKAHKNNEESFKWDLGFRFFDAKTIYQAYRIFKEAPTKAGLAAAMENLGMPFEGREHDALCDAKNTAKIFSQLLWNFKK